MVLTQRGWQWVRLSGRRWSRSRSICECSSAAILLCAVGLFHPGYIRLQLQPEQRQIKSQETEPHKVMVLIVLQQGTDHNHTWLSMLSSISPWVSTNTAKSRKTCIEEILLVYKSEVRDTKLFGAFIYYLLQIKDPILYFFNRVMPLLNFLYCVQNLQM